MDCDNGWHWPVAVGRAPGADAIALRREPRRDGRAHLTEAEHQHRHLVGAELSLLTPLTGLLLGGVVEEAPLQRQHSPKRRLGHRRIHGGINHARQWHL